MKLSKRSSGDLRSAINTLQALVENGGELTEEALESTSQKDNTSTIFDTVTRVLKSTNPEHVKRSMFENTEDPTLVMEYIAENIPREYEKNKEIKKAYEMISQADLYFGRTRSSQYYGYWKYASDFMGVGVSSSKKETYRKYSKIISPMSFSLMGRTRGKRAMRDAIALKMEEKMHVSLQLAYTIFPYFEIMFENDETAWEISDFLELEDDEIKFFRKKKIPKGVITKMEKIKAEMREEEKEEWRNKIKDGIFREIPPQDSENEEENVNFDSDIVEESSSHNATVVDIFDDFSDEELDEIASELSTDGKSKTKLRNDSKSKKEKDEEKLDKGQTTLFSF
jgi:replication factor C large subunit